MSKYSIEDLIRLHRENSTEEIKEEVNNLIRAYDPALRRFWRTKGLRKEDVDDLSQETWEEVLYRSEYKEDPNAEFTTYLIAVSKNTKAESWRREGRRKKREERDYPGIRPKLSNPRQQAEASKFMSDYRACLRDLPDDAFQKTVFLLSARRSYSQEEIMKLIGAKSRTIVWDRIVMATKWMEEALHKREWPNPDVRGILEEGFQWEAEK
ncbi:MAG: hypothetical protein HDKAJFGB_02301 [Anaerolineae bacterium]|nr:hypothetical protein [Anaerolineae bacterium]